MVELNQLLLPKIQVHTNAISNPIDHNKAKSLRGRTWRMIFPMEPTTHTCQNNKARKHRRRHIFLPRPQTWRSNLPLKLSQPAAHCMSVLTSPSHVQVTNCTISPHLGRSTFFAAPYHTPQPIARYPSVISTNTAQHKTTKTKQHQIKQSTTHHHTEIQPHGTQRYLKPAQVLASHSQNKNGQTLKYRFLLL